VLLLTSFALNMDAQTWTSPAFLAFVEGLALYGFLLGFIFIQNKLFKRFGRPNKSTLLCLVNLEIVAFLTVFYFLMGSHRFFNALPLVFHLDTLKFLFALAMYFFALAFYYYISFEFSSNRYRFKQAIQPIFLIVPFALPFLLFTFIIDVIRILSISNFLPSYEDNLMFALLLFLICLLFLVLILVFLPPFIIRIWQCKPLEDSALKIRLESLCKRAKFKHAGIQTWTVMDHALTAAIIGVFPCMRYVMFTKRLLKELPPESIEAILAHEIGHSYRKHLLLFPFIIMGVLVSISFLSLLFAEPFNAWFMLQMRLHPSQLWNLVYPFVIFVLYGTLIALYFRYVFGLFSRLFERQADIHGFALHLDPQHMINALNDIAVATGFTHLQPNWHHYSIQERINFLEKAKNNFKAISAHHQRTRRYLAGYLLIFFIVLNINISSLLKDKFPYKQINIFVNKMSDAMTEHFTAKLRSAVSEKMMLRYSLQGNQIILEDTLNTALKVEASSQVYGSAEFYAASFFLDEGNPSAALKVTAKGLEKVNFDQLSKESKLKIKALIEKVLKASPPNSDDQMKKEEVKKIHDKIENIQE
jgi:Zn-dependent protease with chaperone function